MHRSLSAARRALSVVSIGALTAVGWGVITSVPASATAVSTEAELRTAFASDGLVEFSNDITLVDCGGGGGAIERAIAGPVIVDGHGFTLTQTCPDSGIDDTGTGVLTVQNLTITGGQATGSGGGISAQDDVILINSVFRGNHAGASGGGLSTPGVVTIESSTLDGNDAPLGGAGVFGNLEIHITNSTISNNLGGGISTGVSSESSVTIVNSTVTGNRNAEIGAGIFSSGSVSLVYATVVGNTADVAFSNIDSQQLMSFGSVVAGGVATQDSCLGTPTSFGYNFSDDASCGFTQPTDRQNAGNPGLGALANNGGPTRTMLPAAASPLVNAIRSRAVKPTAPPVSPPTSAASLGRRAPVATSARWRRRSSCHWFR